MNKVRIADIHESAHFGFNLYAKLVEVETGHLIVSATLSYVLDWLRLNPDYICENAKPDKDGAYTLILA